MSHDQNGVRESGRIPILKHECAGGCVPLGAESESVILAECRPVVLAFISSIGDGRDVPFDSTLAMAMVVSGVIEYITGEFVPYPAGDAPSRLDESWERLKAILAVHGERLPWIIQHMMIWTFEPHTACTVLGHHPPATHFMHSWEELFMAGDCVRVLRRIPQQVIDAGDECRDEFTAEVRHAIGGIARCIRLHSEDLIAFLHASQQRQMRSAG